MDRLEAMGVLVRVVETGSFSAASRALRMPLSSVSRKVNELEDHLGARLLARTTRSVALTDAGVAYLASARRILEAVDESERTVAGEFLSPRGELALTAPVLFGRLHILPVVAEFLAAYPQIDVRLQLSDRNLRLMDDHIDLAVRIGALPDSAMVATRVGTMRTVVCASPDWLARHGEPRTPEALADAPCVSFDALAPATAWGFAHGGARFDAPVRPRLSVSTAAAAVAAAAAGVGATQVLHYQCAQAVREGALRIVLADFETPALPVHLIHAGLGALPLKMRVFLDFAASRLRARLAEVEGA